MLHATVTLKLLHCRDVVASWLVPNGVGRGRFPTDLEAAMKRTVFQRHGMPNTRAGSARTRKPEHTFTQFRRQSRDHVLATGFVVCGHIRCKLHDRTQKCISHFGSPASVLPRGRSCPLLL